MHKSFWFGFNFKKPAQYISYILLTTATRTKSKDSTCCCLFFIRSTWAHQKINTQTNNQTNKHFRRYDLYFLIAIIFGVGKNEFCNLKRCYCLLCVFWCSVCQIQIGIWAPTSTFQIYKHEKWPQATCGVRLSTVSREKNVCVSFARSF